MASHVDKNDDCQSRRVQFATETVRQAAMLVRRVQQSMIGRGVEGQFGISSGQSSLAKDDRSPVTIADFAAQALVAHRLAESLPDQFLVGEEDSSLLRSDEGRPILEQVTRFVQEIIPGATSEEICDWIDQGAGDPPDCYWTLDPVDGTKGFLRNNQYAVALAQVERGSVRIGVLGCPELIGASCPDKGGVGSIIVATRGEGTVTQSMDASSGWHELRVSDRTDVADARLLRSVEKAHTDTGGIGRLVSMLGITASPVPLDSQAKYAVLASGAGDVLLRLLSPSRPDYREKVWDQAAGSIVVEEAGGRVTDLDGKPLDFAQGRTLTGNRGVVATNGRLHDAILDGLSRMDA